MRVRSSSSGRFSARHRRRARPLLAAAQQQPAPSATFQVEVDFVDIDAVVTDERGNFVGDLTKDDFELLDDGKPQEISAFSLVDIPVPAAGAQPARGHGGRERRQIQRASPSAAACT